GPRRVPAVSVTGAIIGVPGGTMSTQEQTSVSGELLARMDAYWRAANYLSVGQIYLLDNPLLQEPLQAEHVKPRLLGHWGTTPGLNLIYTHLNRIIASAMRTSSTSRAQAMAGRAWSPTLTWRVPTARCTP